MEANGTVRITSTGKRDLNLPARAVPGQPRGDRPKMHRASVPGGGHVDVPLWYWAEIKDEPAIKNLLARSRDGLAVEGAPSSPRDESKADRRVVTLEADVADARARAADAETRIRELEAQLATDPKSDDGKKSDTKKS